MLAARLFAALAVALCLVGISPAAQAAEWARAPEHVRLETALQAPPPVPDGWTASTMPYGVVYGAERDAEAEARLARHASEAVPRLAEALGLPAGADLRVYLTESEEQFRTLQPGMPPDWADGTAWPHRGLVFLKSPRIRAGTASALEQVLDHEIVHVLLGRAFGDQDPPRWLQEGMAQVMAREVTADKQATLARGQLGGGLLTLEDLSTGFPHNVFRAQLAYAQSADLVAFIQNTWGPEALRTLVAEMAAGRPAAAAIFAATGQRMDEVDVAWRARLASSPMWLSTLAQDGAWWGLAAMLFVVGGLRVRARNRRKLARWDREERLRDAVLEALSRRYEDRAPPPPTFTLAPRLRSLPVFAPQDGVIH